MNDSSLSSSTTTTKPVLYRYWIFADRMREYFETSLLDPAWVKIAAEKKMDPILVFWLHDPGLFMSYWYGGLYVVVDAWKQLGLTDRAVDTLLTSKNVELLRRFRNGIFHYQKNLFDKRFFGMIDSKESAPWASQLTKAFGCYFESERRKFMAPK